MKVTQLHTMSEVVKSGVAQAQEELRKEADNQIWQEGILRYQDKSGQILAWKLTFLHNVTLY